MRAYAKVAPRFWTGETGRHIRAAGADTLVVALYLMTGPHANMIGLYYLPEPFICHETGLTAERVDAALSTLKGLGFMAQDKDAELVWIRQMARFQISASLKPKDKQVAGIHTLLRATPPSPLVEGFTQHYRHAFHLDAMVLADDTVSADARPTPSGPSTRQRREGPGPSYGSGPSRSSGPSHGSSPSHGSRGSGPSHGSHGSLADRNRAALDAHDDAYTPTYIEDSQS